MTKPVLFLDVDGVLNFEECWTKLKIGPTPLHPDNVARLNALCEATGAAVVLSSAWRNILEDVLEAAGALRHKHAEDPRTKNLPHIWDEEGVNIERYRTRGDEIAEWLSRHPEVTTYAIVDDESDMLPEQMPFFVQTDFSGGGLTDEHCDRLRAILNPEAA